MDWLRKRLTDYTPDVGRVFVICCNPKSGAGCRRIVPHYALTGKQSSLGCRHCGGQYFAPTRIPEWKAAWWVLIVGLLWRKTIRSEPEWDPRLPMREARGAYA